MKMMKEKERGDEGSDNDAGDTEDENGNDDHEEENDSEGDNTMKRMWMRMVVVMMSR